MVGTKREYNGDRPSMPLHNGNAVLAPHVVILGAGASVAAFPNGDLRGNKLPLMKNIIDVIGLTSLLKNYGLDAGTNFEVFYDTLATKNVNQQIISKIEDTVFTYFSNLSLPPYPTIYDYLVLSLREKDIIASFNWDPLLLQAFRRNVHLKRLPTLAFLHGNVGLGICYDDNNYGFSDQKCKDCENKFEKSRLLYPVQHKDYNKNVFIKDQWARLRDHLENAYHLTIYGYSAPITDIEAKRLMLEVWQKNKSLKLAEVDIIDIKSEEEVQMAWSDFTYSHHYSVKQDIFDSWLFHFPRRSCEAFFDATLMCRPWKGNPFPKFDTLPKLQEWVMRLIEEENKCEELKEPFSGLPFNT